jgi:type II secretory pathway pseudopilin PulG
MKKAAVIVLTIVVIILLISLLFPCTNCPRNAAKRTHTQIYFQAILNASKAYKSEYGDYPKGDLSEIIHQLAGGNPQRIEFLDRTFDSNKDKLVDAWGTPFRFIPSENNAVFVIISASADRNFDTSDDITTKAQQDAAANP